MCRKNAVRKKKADESIEENVYGISSAESIWNFNIAYVCIGYNIIILILYLQFRMIK